MIPCHYCPDPHRRPLDHPSLIVLIVAVEAQVAFSFPLVAALEAFSIYRPIATLVYHLVQLLS